MYPKIFYLSRLRESEFCENGTRKQKSGNRINQVRGWTVQVSARILKLSRMHTLVTVTTLSACKASDLSKDATYKSSDLPVINSE